MSGAAPSARKLSTVVPAVRPTVSGSLSVTAIPPKPSDVSSATSKLSCSLSTRRPVVGDAGGGCECVSGCGSVHPVMESILKEYVIRNNGLSPIAWQAPMRNTALNCSVPLQLPASSNKRRRKAVALTQAYDRASWPSQKPEKASSLERLTFTSTLGKSISAAQFSPW